MSDEALQARRRQREPLAQLIPGWQGEIPGDSFDRLARGLALEQARLRGSRYLVLLHRYELTYEGQMDWVEVVSGHLRLDDATRTAQAAVGEALARMVEQRVPRLAWLPNKPMFRGWPASLREHNGVPLPRFSERLWDGVGWHALEVDAGVVPTEPFSPINLAVIQAMGDDFETRRWFEQVGSTSGPDHGGGNF